MKSLRSRWIISDRLPTTARRGAAAVEFALTAPILFTLVLGAIELSRANMLMHTTAIAATEAARAGILPGATAEQCKAVGVRELNLIGVSDVKIELEPPVIVEDTKQITVNMSVPVSMRNGYILPRIFLGKEIFKTVTLQREGKSADVAEEAVVKDGVRDEPEIAEDRDESGEGDDDDDD